VASLSLALRVVLLATALLHGVAIAWGMPASDGWDVDGIAPRDFLPGLAETYTPGHYFTYPPLHLALLAVLTAPVTVVAVVRAGSTSVPAVLHEILAPSYMTVMAMTARAVSLLMSLGIVVALAKTAEETAPEKDKKAVLVGAAALVAVDAPFDYYAHVTNLDVPYFFWASLSMLWLVRAIVRREPHRLRKAAVLAACAIATKDQAYAMFVIAVPAALLLWIAADEWARKNLRVLARDALLGAALALALLLVVDGALTNPSGFCARLAFLSGSASQDYATYSKDIGGRWLIVVDTFRAIDFHYPREVLVLAGVGAGATLAQARRIGRAAVVGSILPLLVAISFTVCFNLVARRVEERFTLPQMLVVGMYAGRGAAWLWTVVPARGAGVALASLLRTACVVVVIHALHACLLIDATMLREPRYAAETWLAEHARPEDVIEVHGLNVYLARPTHMARSGAKVVRVGPTPVDRRNPMPGIVEVQAKLSDVRERDPRFIVVNECYVWRYLHLPHLDLPREAQNAHGRILPKTQDRDASDVDATSLFTGLFEGRHGYHLTYEARITDKRLPRYELHASLGCPVWIFERDGAPR
jgi:hypothetical protein